MAITFFLMEPTNWEEEKCDVTKIQICEIMGWMSYSESKMKKPLRQEISHLSTFMFWWITDKPF